MLEPAAAKDVPELVALRIAVAEKLTRTHGTGPWSGVATEAGVRFDLRNSSVYVAHRRGALAATLRLTTRKPWAIDRSYFSDCRRPLYLLSMAVAPDLQLRGLGRECLDEALALARKWPADAVLLDAYDAPAGAGGFYAKCGFQPRGKATFRGCPLLYFERQL